MCRPWFTLRPPSTRQTLWVALAILLATTVWACQSRSSQPVPDRTEVAQTVSGPSPEMDPVERAKRFAWPDGASGFRTGMTDREFDAQCAGSKLTVDADGSRTCLRVLGPERDATLVAGRFCGATVCELSVSAGRTDESDAEWLSALKAQRTSLTARYGPPRVEESSAPGCDGDRVVACSGDGRATRRYSWAFIGRNNEFAVVTLALMPIAIGIVFRNEAWLTREHERDKAEPGRP